MKVMSIAEVKECLEGCKWTCGPAVFVDVKDVGELALELKRALEATVYLNKNDIHIVADNCYTVLTVEKGATGITVREGLSWGI